MHAYYTLFGVSLLLIALTLWDHLRREGRLRSAYRTWLTVAVIFAAIGVVFAWVLR